MLRLIWHRARLRPSRGPVWLVATAAGVALVLYGTSYPLLLAGLWLILPMSWEREPGPVPSEVELLRYGRLRAALMGVAGGALTGPGLITLIAALGILRWGLVHSVALPIGILACVSWLTMCLAGARLATRAAWILAPMGAGPAALIRMATVVAGAGSAIAGLPGIGTTPAEVAHLANSPPVQMASSASHPYLPWAWPGAALEAAHRGHLELSLIYALASLVGAAAALVAWAHLIGRERKEYRARFRRIRPVGSGLYGVVRIILWPSTSFRSNVVFAYVANLAATGAAISDPTPLRIGVALAVAGYGLSGGQLGFGGLGAGYLLRLSGTVIRPARELATLALCIALPGIPLVVIAPLALCLHTGFSHLLTYEALTAAIGFSLLGLFMAAEFLTYRPYLGRRLPLLPGLLVIAGVGGWVGIATSFDGNAGVVLGLGMAAMLVLAGLVVLTWTLDPGRMARRALASLEKEALLT